MPHSLAWPLHGAIWSPKSILFFSRCIHALDIVLISKSEREFELNCNCSYRKYISKEASVRWSEHTGTLVCFFLLAATTKTSEQTSGRTREKSLGTLAGPITTSTPAAVEAACLHTTREMLSEADKIQLYKRQLSLSFSVCVYMAETTPLFNGIAMMM